MKNRFIIFIILFVIFLSPTNVLAEEDLIISDWIVEANLLEDGSLSTVNYITYDFNRNFNGVYVDISLENTIKIYNLLIYEITSGVEVEYTLDQNAKKGQNGIYTTDLTDDSINIMIFSPSEDESKTFKLEYTLKDVAQAHSDIGELYYQFIGDNNEISIENFRANINLPRFNQEDIKIFAHGPSNGDIYFNDQSITLEADNIADNTFIEARILFPLDYIPSATITGNSSFNDIMNEEIRFAEKIQEDGIKKQERKSIFNTVSNGLSAISLLFFAFILNKFKRSADVFDDMVSLYPDEISPAELSLFMNSVIGPRAYIATLLDLARKEFVSFGTILSNKKTKRSKNEEPQSYLFTKKDIPSTKLMEHERFFINWLFNEIGDGKSLSTDEIDNYREKNPTKFHKSQTTWFKIVKDELGERNYFDPLAKKYGKYILMFSFFGLIISVITLVFEGLFGIPLLIISIMLMVYGIFIFSRKSDKGYIQYQLWKDFKKDSNKIDSKSLSLSTDLSLIYLIALGLPMKDLDDYRQSIGMDYYPLHWGYFYFLTNSKGGSSFEDNFNNSFYGSSGTSTANSTSFGGGGGFTGGGGGGVGGSGSGGF